MYNISFLIHIRLVYMIVLIAVKKTIKQGIETMSFYKGNPLFQLSENSYKVYNIKNIH